MHWKKSDESWHKNARMAQSVPAEIVVSLIFRHPKCGDSGMGAVSEKCSCCFLYRNALEMEHVYPKEGARVVGEEPVHAPLRQHPQPPSRFNAKVLREEQYVINAVSSIFPRFSNL